MSGWVATPSNARRLGEQRVDTTGAATLEVVAPERRGLEQRGRLGAGPFQRRGLEEVGDDGVPVVGEPGAHGVDVAVGGDRRGCG